MIVKAMPLFQLFSICNHRNELLNLKSTQDSFNSKHHTPKTDTFWPINKKGYH
jgi:hypothetical protein